MVEDLSLPMYLLNILNIEIFPLKDLVDEEEIAEAVINADEMLWRKEYEYMVNNHSPEIIASMVMKIYSSLLFI